MSRTLWEKINNDGHLECKIENDVFLIQIGVWNDKRYSFNEFAEMNKSQAIKLRDFLNEFIEEQ